MFQIFNNIVIGKFDNVGLHKNRSNIITTATTTTTSTTITATITTHQPLNQKITLCGFQFNTSTLSLAISALTESNV